MNITYEKLEKISNQYGDGFYLLDTEHFKTNYLELQKAFRDIYTNTFIAYSYKTNYTPKLCKAVDELGGFAEVVSEMEYDIAEKVGVEPQNIIFNGPYKSREGIEKLVLSGGIVNLDSHYELAIIKKIAVENPDKTIKLGLRCNFDINDGVTSRFGFDVEDNSFSDAIKLLRSIENINLAGLHCHFATRSLETWPKRAEGMLELVKMHFDVPPEFISLGGGLFGKMGESLKEQFDVEIPDYKQYADATAPLFKDYFSDIETNKQPKLILEPGSALVGDAMKFAARVINIKNIRGKSIATLAGSMYNINPTLNKKNPPINIYHDDNSLYRQQMYNNLDFGGYTCIEADYLYRGFNGKLAVGDFVVFDNIGSYSIVLKPPFILPNFAMVEYDEGTDSIEIVKHKEKFEDLFKTFKF